MNAPTRQSVVPIYLFLCLILGGSAQAVWGSLLLQLLGLAIIAWSLIARPVEAALSPVRQLLILVCVGLGLAMFQLVPVPPPVWTRLGGRDVIVDGFAILGTPLPWLPISIAPYATIDALLDAIPPVAIILGVVRLKAYRPAFAAIALIAGTVAGIGLSALQLSTAQVATSPFYLYAVTNRGFGVGFFANANHMAALLVVTIPFLAALVATARGAQVQRYSAFLAVCAGIAILLLVGIALNRSLAGYGLAVPVALASIALFIVNRHRAAGVFGAAALAAGIGAAAILATTAIGQTGLGSEASASLRSRTEILAPTLHLAKTFFPAGSGLGTFVDVFPLSEDPLRVIHTYVNHAHNDWAEWLLETGLAGMILALAFLLWWARQVIATWRTADTAAFARAASIASAALLVHSIVDYPLRTSALAAVFGLCVSILADRRSPQRVDSADLRPTRHVVIR